MLLALGIGKGPVLGWLPIALIIVTLASVIFLGWRRYKFVLGARLAIGYLLLLVIPCLFSRVDFIVMVISTALTLPCSLFLPDLLIDQIGNRTLGGMLFICAELNAIAIYFIAVFLSRRKMVIANAQSNNSFNRSA
jgi:hypothetical protein